MRPHHIALGILATLTILQVQEELKPVYELRQEEALIEIRKEIIEEQKPVVVQRLDVRPQSKIPKFQGPGLEYIGMIYPYAKALEKDGIPPSITIAQAMTETGNGRSRLARLHNNHFGIKIFTGWRGKSVPMHDDGPDDRFCEFKTLEHCFQVRRVFLERGRYAPIRAKRFDRQHFSKYRYNSNDPNFTAKLNRLEKNWDNPRIRWALALDIVGYATDNRYAEKLLDKIDRHNLHIADADFTPE